MLQNISLYENGNFRGVYRTGAQQFDKVKCNYLFSC